MKTIQALSCGEATSGKVRLANRQIQIEYPHRIPHGGISAFEEPVMTRNTPDKEKHDVAATTRFMLAAGMLAALVLAVPTTAFALATPGIASVSVQCEIIQGAPNVLDTVRINFDSMIHMGLEFDFRNVATGQTVSFQLIANTWPSNPFPVPPGTYNLTVRQNYGQHSWSVWNNIVVPHTVSTNGKGTGCRFLSPGETPASGPVPMRN